MFRLSVVASSQCFNGIDDDRDGFIDIRDPDCIGPADNTEEQSYDSSLQAFMISFPDRVDVVHSTVLGTYIRFRE